MARSEDGHTISAANVTHATLVSRTGAGATIGAYSWEAFKGAPTGVEVWEALFDLMFSPPEA